MTAGLEQECQQLRSKWAARAATLRDEAKTAVVDSARNDTTDPELSGDPSAYARRAMAIALGLADGDSYSLAADNLGWIARQAKSYGGQELEAFIRSLVFQGIAQTRMYDFDGGVAKIAFATERILNASVTDWESSWVKEYLFDEFESWGIRLLAGTAKYPRWIKDSEIHARQALGLLGVHSYSASSAIRSIFRLAELHSKTPSDYTRMRLLDGYRTLTASMEALAKTIGRNSLHPKTVKDFQVAKKILLGWALPELLRGTSVWQRAEEIKSNLPQGLTIDPNDPFASLSQKIAVVRREPRDSLDKLLGQALVAAPLVRNFAAHETTFGEVVSDQQVYSTIGELTIAAFVYLPYMCQKAGHIEKFCDD